MRILAIVAVLVVALSGCFGGYGVKLQRQQILNSMTPEQKQEWLASDSKAQQDAAAAKPFYTVATFGMIIGIGIVAVAKTLSRVGFGIMGGSVLSAAIGRKIPQIAEYAFWAIVALSVIGAAYWIWCYLPRGDRHEAQEKCPVKR